MNMFDWQAPPGQSLVTSRFWIYWAVTVPFTFIIFGIWLSWLGAHKHSQDEPFEERLAAISSDKLAPKRVIHHKSEPAKLTMLWKSLMRSAVKVKLESEEDGAEAIELEQVSNLATTTGAGQPGNSHPTIRKRNTFVQGPRR
jgi:hypothetical protein